MAKYSDLTDAAAVSGAIAEFDEPGRDAFLNTLIGTEQVEPVRNVRLLVWPQSTMGRRLCRGGHLNACLST